MSAWVVSYDHIDALLTFASRDHLSYVGVRERADKTEIGRILLKENVRSVAHRYPDCDGEADLPGGGQLADSYKFRSFEPFDRMPREKMIAWVLKACACFDYQSCETDDYTQSLAYKIIRSIEKEAISRLPHYEDAPWGIDRVRVGS